MQPKTELQRIVFASSKNISPLSNEQIAYGENKFQGYFTLSTRFVYCLECGNKFKRKASQIKNRKFTCTCSEKPLKLLRMADQDRYRSFAHYTAVIDTCDTFQVVRLIINQKSVVKGRKSSVYSSEVMQHWINSQGKHIIMSKSVAGMSMYYDNWIISSDLEIRATNSNRAYSRHNITPDYIFPNKKVQSYIKNNGFKSSFYGANPHQLFIELLKNNLAERLLKINQGALLNTLISTKDYDKFENYFNSFRIANKHGYRIKSASDYIDYLDLLIHFEKDIRSPKYLCPSNFEKEHNKFQEKKRKQLLAEKKEKLKEEIIKHQKTYKKKKSVFFDLFFQKNNIFVTVLKHVKDFLEEGDRHHHCVFTNEYFKKNQALVLSAKVDGVPTETVELSLNTFKIVQSRGKDNKPTKYHKQIIQLVTQNIPKIQDVLKLKEAS